MPAPATLAAASLLAALTAAAAVAAVLRRRRRRSAAACWRRRLSAPQQEGADQLLSNADQPFVHLPCGAAPAAAVEGSGAPSPTPAPALLPDFEPALACCWTWHGPYHVHASGERAAHTDTAAPREAGSHPHAAAIQQLIATSASCGDYCAVRPPQPTDAPPHDGVSPRRVQLVETRRQLARLGHLLQRLPRFAVDTEHHARHSYLGVTCLIQISTGAREYLVDTLRLWRWVGPALRPAFSDPAIVKVLHGATNDVLWLQRDFRLYLVNVFDTERAAVLLRQPSSLAALLQRLCGVETDKRLQHADWRTRPLTPAMRQYAVADVRHLLFIADCLQQQLRAARPPQLGEALRRGQLLTLQLYARRSHADEVRGACVPLTRRLLAALDQDLDAALGTPGDPPAAAAGATVGAGGSGGGGHAGAPPPPAPAAAAAVPRSADLLRACAPPEVVSAAVAAQVEALCCWRDITARHADVSPEVVLPDGLLLALVLAQPRSADLVLDVLELHGWAPLGGGGGDAEDDEDEDSRWGEGHAAAGERNPLAERSVAQAQALHALLSGAAEAAAPGVRLPSPLTSSGGAVGAGKRGAAPAAGVSQGQAHLRALPAAKRQFVLRNLASKSEVYGNCRMLAHNGEVLCHTDRKKVEWYLSKGLAERVPPPPGAGEEGGEEAQPLTIRLLFEHKQADQHAGVDFYTHSRLNRCVVCGAEEHYLRFRIVPSAYRRHFPVELKSHRSHDVVLLCVACHQTAQAASEVCKRQVLRDYGVPLHAPRVLASAAAGAAGGGNPCDHRDSSSCGSGDDADQVEEQRDHDCGGEGQCRRDVSAPSSSSGPSAASAVPAQDPLQAQRAAVALGKAAARLPPARRLELEHTIKRALGRHPAGEPEGLREGDLEAARLLGLSARQQRKLLASLPPHLAQLAQQALQGLGASGCGPATVGPGGAGGESWLGERVVAAALARGGHEELHRLVTRFRAHFVEHCRPRFLPPAWSVSHQQARQFGNYSVYAPNKLPPEPPLLARDHAAGGVLPRGPAAADSDDDGDSVQAVDDCC